MMADFNLSIRKVYAMDILHGRKHVEARRSIRVKKLQVGMTLGFHWYQPNTKLYCKVLGLHDFDSLQNMIHIISHRTLMLESASAEDCIAV